MPIKDAKGETEARIFFIAYTLDDAWPFEPRARSCSASTAARDRPRSGCTWGRSGPRRVAITERPTIPPPPFQLVDNEATWLDRTDLVFIDPVGTGFSRAAKPELNAKFHALRGDITSVGEFIRMYLTRYERCGRRRFLDRRELRHDPRRRLDRLPGRPGHRVQRRDPGLLRPRLPRLRLQREQRPAVLELSSLVRGLGLVPQEAAGRPAAARLAGACSRKSKLWSTTNTPSILRAATGSPTTSGGGRRTSGAIHRAEGRRDRRATTCGSAQSTFCKELLKIRATVDRPVRRAVSRHRDRRLRLPRPQLRPQLWRVSAPPTRRPSTTTSATELGYKTDVPYYILGEGVGRWDWQTEMGYPTTTDELNDALTKNPHMKVLIASGYYDLATPYRAVEHTLARPGTRSGAAQEHHDRTVRSRAT